MNWSLTIAVRLIEALRRIREKKLVFFGFFVGIFFFSVVTLGKYDLVPNPLRVSITPTVALATSTVVAASSTAPTVREEPMKITITKIGLVATIANPTTTKIAVLDQALLSGAVRYPTSAKLGEMGNVVLFGHSSYLPVVGNPAYKTFNGIQKLVAGDVVTVYSAGTAYTYSVRTMQKESAASDAGIALAVAGHVLTLATCDSFGAKSDRFVVTADFVESHSISI